MKRDQRHEPAPVRRRESRADVLAAIVHAMRQGARQGSGGMDEVECGDLMRRWRESE